MRTKKLVLSFDEWFAAIKYHGVRCAKCNNNLSLDKVRICPPESEMDSNMRYLCPDCL